MPFTEDRAGCHYLQAGLRLEAFDAMNSKGGSISRSADGLWQQVRARVRWLSRLGADDEPVGHVRRAAQLLFPSALMGLTLLVDAYGQERVFPS